MPPAKRQELRGLLENAVGRGADWVRRKNPPQTASARATKEGSSSQPQHPQHDPRDDRRPQANMHRQEVKVRSRTEVKHTHIHTAACATLRSAFRAGTCPAQEEESI